MGRGNKWLPSATLIDQTASSKKGRPCGASSSSVRQQGRFGKRNGITDDTLGLGFNRRAGAWNVNFEKRSVGAFYIVSQSLWIRSRVFANISSAVSGLPRAPERDIVTRAPTSVDVAHPSDTIVVLLAPVKVDVYHWIPRDYRRN